MSKSERVGLFEREQSARELQQREVVLGFLRPADQERAVSVEPGVTGLDYPAASVPVRPAALQLDFVAAAADVRLEAASGGEFTDPGVGVAAVEAQPLRIVG